MSAVAIDVVVPIRYSDCCGADGTPRFRLQDRALWDITFDQALAAKSPRRVIVAYDDPRFEAALAPRAGAVVGYRRPAHLSEPGITTLDVLADVAADALQSGNASDYMLLLEITHPLRPRGIVDEVTRAIEASRPDSLITCHRVRYNFWRRAEDASMERIRGAGEPGAGAVFQELIGIASAFRTDLLAGDNPFGERVDMAPIDRFWATVDVRDADGLWLAERYLERIGARV